MPTRDLHWPEYLIEALFLGLFMLSASTFAALLQHPASPVAGWLATPFARRIPMGIAMGLTAMALIYSPLGKRSGAHMNPAVTLAFLRLGKIERRDAIAYIAAQFAGGTAGMLAAALLFGGLLSHVSVNYVATLPGPSGWAPAFGAEAVISFALMSTVLRMSNSPRFARFTGAIAGVLVATCIVIESPLSGTSMNPARTLGSNLLAHSTQTLWIYFTAPPLGMLVAAELALRLRGQSWVRCAKLHHTPDVRCIFRCGHGHAPTEMLG